MADLQDGISLDRHLELRSYAFKRPVRYVVVTLLVAFLLIGLLNGFGQRPAGTVAVSPAASLEL